MSGSPRRSSGGKALRASAFRFGSERPSAVVRGDEHEAERRMMRDVGVFRPQRHTVDDLLKDRARQADLRRSLKARSTVTSAAPVPPLSPSSLPPPPPPPPREEDLVSTLVTRLAALEEADLEQRRALRAATDEAAALRMRLRDAGERATDEVYHLRLENERLQRQTSEMERFLADYGLVWVGYRADTGVNEVAAAAANEDESSRGLFFDFGRLRAAVRDLNQLACEGQMRVVQRNGVARLEPPPTVRLVVYRNGIFTRGGPLRPFSQQPARAFVQDMLDGFFPGELRGEFPDGVVFDLVDRSGEDYSSSSSSQEQQQRSAANMLRRLPASVVRNGKVVAIRAAIAAGAGGGGGGDGSDLTVVDTEAMRNAGDEEVATLQVKGGGGGGGGLLIKMRYDDTVGDVLDAVARHRGGGGGEGAGEARAPSLELVTNFPRRTYGRAETLRAAGLVPNATVIARAAAAEAPPT